MEVLMLTTWSENVMLTFIRDLLRGGLHRHLSQNPYLRPIFGLGAPLLVSRQLTKEEKADLKIAHDCSKRSRQSGRQAARDFKQAL